MREKSISQEVTFFMLLEEISILKKKERQMKAVGVETFLFARADRFGVLNISELFMFKCGLNLSETEGGLVASSNRNNLQIGLNSNRT